LLSPSTAYPSLHTTGRTRQASLSICKKTADRRGGSHRVTTNPETEGRPPMQPHSTTRAIAPHATPASNPSLSAPSRRTLACVARIHPEARAPARVLAPAPALALALVQPQVHSCPCPCPRAVFWPCHPVASWPCRPWLVRQQARARARARAPAAVGVLAHRALAGTAPRTPPRSPASAQRSDVNASSKGMRLSLLAVRAAGGYGGIGSWLR
jgi:hypothetical protein